MQGQVDYGTQVRHFRDVVNGTPKGRNTIMDDQQPKPEADASLLAKLRAAHTRANDPKNRIDVSDLTSEQFVELLRKGTYAAK